MSGAALTVASPGRRSNTYGPTFGVAVAPNYPADGSVWATYRFIESPGDGTPESSVIRSTDGGEHWSISGVGLPGYYSPFPRMLGVSPNYAVDRQVFAALYGEPVGPPEHSLFRSYDGGESWVDLGPAPGNPDVLGVVVTYAPDDGVRVHLATTQGVWHYGGVCEQRLVNGGFETDAAWIFPATPFPADYSILQVHSGYRSLHAGVLDGATTCAVIRLVSSPSSFRPMR